MRRLSIALLTALGACLTVSGNASACMCDGAEEAGFMHASLARLPANTRGALFLAPPGLAASAALKPAAFTIVSDRDHTPLGAEISWPSLGVIRPGQPGSGRLVRVGPVGGFKPGARYTISYNGQAGNWRYPARAAFTIDAAPLTIARYQLVAAGAPVRRMLRLAEDAAACARQQAADVAEFDYRIPDHYKPYRSAMIYVSETLAADGKANLVTYSPSLCAPWTLDAVTGRDGRDLVHMSCEQPGPRLTVRGHAGLLEVEDSLQATNDLPLDFGKTAGGACGATAMLNQAVARADTAQIKQLACEVGLERWRLDQSPQSALPSPGTLLAIARLRDALPEQCTSNLSYKWREESRHALGPVLGPVVHALYKLDYDLRERFNFLADSVTSASRP